MYQSVKEHVAACDTCQKTKSETMAPAGLLQPLLIPNRVWEDISMDFIDGLPISKGKNSILVVVDRLSKSAHFLALSHPYIAKTVAEKFVEGIVKHHGLPQSIIFDRDSLFMSKFWQELFKMSETRMKMSSSYHPQTDGQTEVINRCLEQYLRSFVHQQPRQWFAYLSWTKFWYNTTYHASIGMTPFEALYGRPPPEIPKYQDGTSAVNEVDLMLRSRNKVMGQLKENLQATNNRMKQFTYGNCRDIEYQVGDYVYLKLQPHRQQSVFRRTSQKLANKYYGPYQIMEKIGKVTYRL